MALLLMDATFSTESSRAHRFYSRDDGGLCPEFADAVICLGYVKRGEVAAELSLCLHSPVYDRGNQLCILAMNSRGKAYGSWTSHHGDEFHASARPARFIRKVRRPFR